MLRINKIPYTVECSDLPFAMDRPLPLLLHGEYIFSSRNIVLEHVASYKPMASQSSDSEFGMTTLTTSAAFSDDATLSAYFEKMEALLLHWKRLRGLDAEDEARCLPLMHSLSLWLSSSCSAALASSAATRMLPDVSEENLLQRLGEFYAVLNRLLAGLSEKHGFVGTVLSASYRAPISGDGTPFRRQSINFSSSSSGSGITGGGMGGIGVLGRTYAVADALLFGHLTQARCLPEVAALLTQHEALMQYYKTMAAALFSNEANGGGEGLGGPWDHNTYEVLRSNRFARRPGTLAALRGALAFDMTLAETQKKAAAEAATETDVAAGEEDGYGSYRENTQVLRSRLSVDYGPVRGLLAWLRGGNARRGHESSPELVRGCKGQLQWARVVPMSGVAFALTVSVGIFTGFLMHRK